LGLQPEGSIDPSDSPNHLAEIRIRKSPSLSLGNSERLYRPRDDCEVAIRGYD
jgi:hypothetical protein